MLPDFDVSLELTISKIQSSNLPSQRVQKRFILLMNDSTQRTIITHSFSFETMNRPKWLSRPNQCWCLDFIYRVDSLRSSTDFDSWTNILCIAQERVENTTKITCDHLHFSLVDSGSKFDLRITWKEKKKHYVYLSNVYVRNEIEFRRVFLKLWIDWKLIDTDIAHFELVTFNSLQSVRYVCVQSMCTTNRQECIESLYTHAHIYAWDVE